MFSKQDAIGRVWVESDVVELFHQICDTGGRMAGSESELQARELISGRIRGMEGEAVDHSYSYQGNLPVSATLSIAGVLHSKLEAIALPGSPGCEQLVLPVVDAGLGRDEDFDALGGRMKGALVLVRHEYPFSSQHMHRTLKYKRAIQAGAAAFAIANTAPGGGPVAGGATATEHGHIPAVGISYEAAEELRICSLGSGEVSLSVSVETKRWDATNLMQHARGKTGRYVVLCAHIDGHDLGESAMDNATGMAVATEVYRLLSPFATDFENGLRLAFFTTEEWGLDGSREWLSSLSDSERDDIVCAFALDSVTGHRRLSALTAGDPLMNGIVNSLARDTATRVDIVEPFRANSDHANFQSLGIPAMRIMAGYGHEDSMTRFLLTRSDTRSIVEPTELKTAASVVLDLVVRAMSNEFIA